VNESDGVRVYILVSDSVNYVSITPGGRSLGDVRTFSARTEL